MLKVVFDTVVFVRALINPFSYCGRIVFEHSAAYRLFLSQPILDEILQVLRRPELTSKFQTLAELDVVKVLDIVAGAEVADPLPVAHGSRDPADDKFLGAVEAVDADYLVSEDKDLRVLGHYGRTTIIDCEELLTILERLP